MKKVLDSPLSALDEDEQIACLLEEINSLELRIESLSRDNDALNRDNALLSKDLMKTQEESLHWKSEWGKLVEQIKIMNARYFGATSEKISPHQISLFNDMEAASDLEAKEPDAKKLLPKKRKKKTHIDYSKFETVVITHELSKEERACTVCGNTMDEMATEIKRIIRLVPARLVVEEHRRKVYVCTPCSKENAEDGVTPAQIIKAPLPKFPRPTPRLNLPRLSPLSMRSCCAGF